ncbi:hypothetical protein BDY24DRAFT_385412 [Mrakia frigida]|uniref:uncharacterized protein n=1 Tax=Mrakia frigida TaxID=29902 RepID=UPI003FCC07DD
MANAPTLLSIPVELHRAIILALHDPLQLPTTSRLTNGLFDAPRPALADDPGRRGLMALSLTCRALRDLAQSVLFSRVELGSLTTLKSLAGRVGTLGGKEETEEEEKEEEERRKELCAGIRWLHIDFSLFLNQRITNFWTTLPLLQSLLSSVPDLRILTFEAGRFDALILSHLSMHLHSNSLLPLLTSFGLKETSPRQPPGAPSHDPMVALLPIFKGREGLKWIQIETAEGVDVERLEMMVNEWKESKMRLRGLRVSVQGTATKAEVFLALLTNEDVGGEELAEEMRELVVKLPRWNESSTLPVAVGHVNPLLSSLTPLRNLHTLSVGFGFAPANSTVYKDASIVLANAIPSLELVFWPGYRRPNRVYGVRIRRRVRGEEERQDATESGSDAGEDGEFLHVEEEDLILLGLVAGDEGWRKDEWAEGVGGERDWARLLA